MKKLLLLTGGLAAGKSTFSRILSTRYGTAAFQKDTVKELLCDHIGFRNREENKAISNAAVDAMCHIFSRISLTGASLILEANFHEDELEKLHSIARESQYDVLTLVLHGDAEVCTAGISTACGKKTAIPPIPHSLWKKKRTSLKWRNSSSRSRYREKRW